MYKPIKRIIDIFVASIALIILSPLLIPVIIILILTGEHEVFYRQKRVGYKNKRFMIWKFATMVKNSPNIGTGSITTRNDPRVLPFGLFLRKTKINELPQIINLITGEMSLVGPRPLMEVDFNKYDQKIQNVIYNTKPGLTGLGSVVFRDEQKLVSETKIPVAEYYKNYILPYKGELELWYQKNCSFIVDSELVFLTVWIIMFPESELLQKLLINLPERPIITE